MIQAIKECFDIKNISLARFLGLSVDMVNSVLTNRRELGLEQWQAITRLFDALEKTTEWEALAGTAEVPEEQSIESARQKARLIKKLERLLLRKQEQLAQMKTNRPLWLRGLYACRQLLKGNDLSNEQRLWVEKRKRHLELRLGEQSPWKQQLLQADIKGLQARLGVLRGY